MKVLLIAYHFPPDRAVGAVRAGNVAAALQAAGHVVKVITARLPGEHAARRTVAGFDVHATRLLPTLRDFYAWGKRQLHVPNTPARDWPKSMPAWKRHLMSLMWLPDDRTGFILPALRAARRELRHGIDLVYTTAPPFSVHLIGLALRTLAGSRLRWAAEFRDPWTDNPGKPDHFRSRWSDAIERWLERQCLRSADHVIAVTDSARELFIENAADADIERKTIVVRNGIETLSQGLSRRNGNGRRPLRIVHIGTFYGWRDPRPFLAGLAAAARQCDGQSVDIEVDLIGDCRWFRNVSIEQAAADMGLGDRIRFRDWVARDDAMSAMSNADLLLLLAQNQPAQVPAKLYEYLGTRIPILAFADATGEVARMLRRAGGHYIVTDHDPGAAAQVIGRALQDVRASREPVGDAAVLEQWTLDGQLKHLRAALEG